jgi:hypothetical protein
MKKNILVVYYTQSGQLKDIADSIARPFMDSDKYHLAYHEIKMEEEFPFPWSGESFFGAFPDTFNQEIHPVKPVSQEILSTNFDLILLHYQVWYLTPSIPINSFIHSNDGRQLLHGKPVVTVSGSRNMWLLAQEKVKKSLKEVGAKLVGNVALVDHAPNLISVVTIVDWMFTGVKRRYLGLFPLPGVADKDILDSQKFGEIIQKHLEDGSLETLQTSLVANHAVKVKPFLLSVDQKGNRIFSKWASVMRKYPQQRKIHLKLFNYYLLVALYVVSPIVFIFHKLSYPFWRKSFLKEKHYYEGV